MSTPSTKNWNCSCRESVQKDKIFWSDKKKTYVHELTYQKKLIKIVEFICLTNLARLAYSAAPGSL